MNGFLNTGKTARLWLGPLQIQVWRDGFWVIGLGAHAIHGRFH